MMGLMWGVKVCTLIEVNVLNTLGRSLEGKFVWIRYVCTCNVSTCTYFVPIRILLPVNALNYFWT